MNVGERRKLQMWGEKTRVYTGHKKYYDELVSEYPEWFPNLTDLFEVSAALGISHDRQEDVERKEQLANLANLDSAVFYVLLRLRFPEKSDEERLVELEKFAEYGVSTLYSEMRENGEVGFLQYLRPAIESCKQ